MENKETVGVKEQKRLKAMDMRIAKKMKKEIERQKIRMLTNEELWHFALRKKHIMKVLKELTFCINF